MTTLETTPNDPNNAAKPNKKDNNIATKYLNSLTLSVLYTTDTLSHKYIFYMTNDTQSLDKPPQNL